MKIGGHLKGLGELYVPGVEMDNPRDVIRNIARWMWKNAR